VLSVDFVGAPIYERDNPCFHDYTVGANEVDGIIQLTIVELDPPPMQPPPLPSGVEMSCPSVGFYRHAEVDLSEPFNGTTVESSGGVFFIAPPKGLVELGGVPDGWSVAASEDLPESPSGRWQRSWSNADMLPHQSEPGRFDLIQAFGSNVGVTGGEQVAGPRVNGRLALLWIWDPTGELVLVWQLDGLGLALVANEADFAVEQLVELAESAYLPE
jgi:hypothetical protein